MTAPSAPGDENIRLKVLLVSGASHEFTFPPETTAQDIADEIYSEWPQDWERKPDHNILRLIYQGRFLHGNVTLSAMNLPSDSTTVVHLVQRETLPEPGKQGQNKKSKTGNPGCCNSCCSLS